MKIATFTSRLLALLLLASPLTAAIAQSGKISGTVRDARTNEPLPGVNIVIVGTTQGTSTDLEGYYVILNVKPGTHTVRASFLGYANQTVEEVRVAIDQTTELDFEMREEAIVGEEIVVSAERPVVQRDVSASVANISSEQIENLPVVSVTSVVGLQAGVEGGLTIRGGGSDQVAFMVNGLALRDERDNTPYTGISYTSVEEIQIQTGGFNAEYGNVRSGVVNVVTKEGSPDRYTVDVITRYSPPSQKNFGPSANDPDSYWIRPYLDPDVAWTGTQNGAWDSFTQQQYPEFEGWIQVAEATLANDDPSDDLTPEAAQQIFLWQHRKQLKITEPDYDVDVGIGGPVPAVSDRLGNLRFFASYRQARDMYLIPLSREDYKDYNGQVKLTSDLAPGMKLSVEGLFGRALGTNSSTSGLPGLFRSASGLASNLCIGGIGCAGGVGFINSRVFASDYWSPSAVTRSMVGGRFSHAVSSRTFYEVYLNRFASAYDTNPGRRRELTPVRTIGGVPVTEAPFGWEPLFITGVSGSTGINGLRMGVGMSNSRDSSRVAVWTSRFDVTSQVNRFNQVKTGLELVYTENRTNYASVDSVLISGRTWSRWNSYPVRGAAYVQDKLEFKGMIANLGLRLDYSHAGGDWYVYDPFTDAFSARNSLGIDTLLEKTPTKRIVTLSPRLGISFPVTEGSKLFFNYGHFRSMPGPENLYLVRRFTDNNAITRIADPNNPLPLTVAYELGYEQSLFGQYLVRLAGYYKDVSLQPRLVTFQSRDAQVNYSVSRPDSYEDIRGFEITLMKNRGRWIQGFLNYTYMVETSGVFGFSRQYENPGDQRRHESNERRDIYQSRPVPRPYARANIELISPAGFGPRVAGLSPLGDWRVSFIGNWRAGSYFTWVGGGSKPGVRNNVQVTDYYNVDMRLTKNFSALGRRAQLFVDVSNLFNTQRFSWNGFVDARDYEAYMKSLHLPEDLREDLSYGYVFGDDRPGTYRDPDVAFVPIQWAVDRAAVEALENPTPNALYYDAAAGQYLQYTGTGFQAADPGRVRQVLDDKAYIDMPNQAFLNFLDPRDVYFGLRITL